MINFPENIDATRFLKEYWQKKPLLIKQGIPQFESPLDGDELAGLALEEDIESRIILEQGFQSPWELHQGPFKEDFFSTLPTSPWTLLVQAVDLWVPDVNDIIAHFNFLPRWRIDDIMVSYANDGGSVGPHFDAYDVFLLQGQGSRQWSIGEQCNQHSPLRQDTPLKILSDFSATESWLLEAGDILYLPPGLAHHGVAVGECMSYSVGFRAPSAAEMLDDLATETMSKSQEQDIYYKDPPLTPAMASVNIDPAFIRQAKSLLLNVLDDEKMLGDWFARYMTSPKYDYLFFEEPSLQRQATAPASGKTFIDGQEKET